MTATEYTICVSDTPERLAAAVTELLAQGWELYGYPFVGGQSPAAGNGHENGHRAMCQAMVRPSARAHAGVAPVKPAPVPKEATLLAPPLPSPQKTPPAKPAIVRPPRPRVEVTLRNLAAFLALLAFASLLGDVLIFRSGFYGQFLEPLSTTGSFERILYAEVHRPPSGKNEVLVLGNSRLAEGFSARIANEYKPQDNFWFANCAVAGTPARAWYYFARDVDPHRTRYAAIAIPLDDYDDPDDTSDPAEQVWEMNYIINRLRLTDILPFTLSFKSWSTRFEALRGSTCKGLVLQRDLYDFFQRPGERLESVKAYREHGTAWFYAYGGALPSLAGVSVDWAARRATFPPGLPENQQQELNRLFFTPPPPQNGYTRDYQVRWLAALADLYRGSKTRIVIYQIPRNLAPNPAPPARLPWTTVDELRKRPWVSVVDRHVFEPLEKPEFFADYLHMNAEGRKQFSPLLADTVKERLQ
jgi:hypothetical protein